MRCLLTDTVMSRLRRESRDARKIRYSASRIRTSTKNNANDTFSIIFFHFFSIMCKKSTKMIFRNAFFAIANVKTSEIFLPALLHENEFGGAARDKIAREAGSDNGGNKAMISRAGGAALVLKTPS